MSPEPSVILVEPQLGENIGAAARAMANFELCELRLVTPRDGWPNEAARKTASGADEIIDSAKVFSNLADAITDLQYVIATTARSRDMMKPVMSPEKAAQNIHTKALTGQRCGMLFGRERWGLTNDEIAVCDAIVMIPVNSQFSSLNISQAVLILAYEWFKHKALEGSDNLSKEELSSGKTKLANKAEMLGLFEHIERELDASGFFRPEERRPSMVRSIRNMFGRMQAKEQDVKTLRGIISSLARSRKTD